MNSHDLAVIDKLIRGFSLAMSTWSTRPPHGASVHGTTADHVITRAKAFEDYIRDGKPAKTS